MKEQLKAHEAKMQKTLDVLAKELAAVRAGRANPAVLDKILAENPLKGEYFLPGVVDRLREDLFACSGFAREQHRRVRRGDFACQIHGLTERSGGTDDTVERMFVGHFCFKTRQAPRHLRFLRRTA